MSPTHQRFWCAMVLIYRPISCVALARGNLSKARISSAWQVMVTSDCVQWTRAVIFCIAVMMCVLPHPRCSTCTMQHTVTHTLAYLAQNWWAVAQISKCSRGLILRRRRPTFYGSLACTLNAHLLTALATL